MFYHISQLQFNAKNDTQAKAADEVKENPYPGKKKNNNKDR